MFDKPEETEATVKKVWDDADNQDGKRPASLEVTLSNGTKVTLNEGNSWTATIDKLPKYANGKEISDSLYDYSLIRNYKNSGRTLLKVSIKESNSREYSSVSHFIKYIHFSFNVIGSSVWSSSLSIIISDFGIDD